ncbi:hypothetical protein BJI67_00650 [Acidihalobacter aeolianus]|uniref:Uncharacterized protein n=1 Tax=Acidihalobacter aeolianus TaxID=2792603 RepID=A0A1D8K478_9GAMM|nr:hypothetical protein BJI67_00650 [Acidihalobacter aeolianus]
MACDEQDAGRKQSGDGYRDHGIAEDQQSREETSPAEIVQSLARVRTQTLGGGQMPEQGEIAGEQQRCQGGAGHAKRAQIDAGQGRADGGANRHAAPGHQHLAVQREHGSRSWRNAQAQHQRQGHDQPDPEPGGRFEKRAEQETQCEQHPVARRG